MKPRSVVAIAGLWRRNSARQPADRPLNSMLWLQQNSRRPQVLRDLLAEIMGKCPHDPTSAADHRPQTVEIKAAHLLLPQEMDVSRFIGSLPYRDGSLRAPAAALPPSPVTLKFGKPKGDTKSVRQMQRSKINDHFLTKWSAFGRHAN